MNLPDIYGEAQRIMRRVQDKPVSRWEAGYMSVDEARTVAVALAMAIREVRGFTPTTPKQVAEAERTQRQAQRDGYEARECVCCHETKRWRGYNRTCPSCIKRAQRDRRAGERKEASCTT